MDCVEEIPGTANIILSIKNNCAQYATKEQLQEMNDLLVKQIGGGAGCKDTKEEKDNEVFCLL